MYALTALLSANRIGQHHSPPDTDLTPLKGKHFGYIRSRRIRFIYLCIQKERSILQKMTQNQNLNSAKNAKYIGTLKTKCCMCAYTYCFVVHLFKTISIFIVLIMHTNVNYNQYPDWWRTAVDLTESHLCGCKDNTWSSTVVGWPMEWWLCAVVVHYVVEWRT